MKNVKFSLFAFGEVNMMRNIMNKLLKEELRVLAIRTRGHLQITQREMARRLEISESAYSNIETGASMCGTLTAILLLLQQEDSRSCLKDFGEKLEEQYEKEMEEL